MKAHLAEETLHEYLDDALDADTRLVAEEHLATCRACRRRLQTLQNLWMALSRLEAPPPPDLVSGILARLSSRRLLIGWRLLLAVQIGLASAVLLLAANALRIALIPLKPWSYLASAGQQLFKAVENALLQGFQSWSSLAAQLEIPSLPLPVISCHPRFLLPLPLTFSLLVITPVLWWLGIQRLLCNGQECSNTSM